MDLRQAHPRAWKVLIGSLAVAALAASWGAMGGAGCQSCQGVAEVIHGKNLATLGTLYYSILLVAAIFTGPKLFLFSGVMIAAGIHGPLVALLFQAKVFCLPCLVAAAAAGAAVVSVIILAPTNAFRGALLFPGTAFLFQTWILLSGAVPHSAQSKSSVEHLAREEFRSAPVEPGKARMVVYTRPDCGYCMELERDILPGVEKDFGNRLLVERRSAESLPGIPTPTIILSGSERRRLFPGLPPEADLRLAIKNVMGDSDDRETVSQEPR
jgi:hypothetical protein